MKMTGMEARRQRSMVVVIEGRMGPAMEEKGFCMSMTRRTEVSGFGSLNLVSNFLYEDFEVFETDMVGNSSVLMRR